MTEEIERFDPMELHAAIALLCPIHGISIGRRQDRTTWRIDFDPEATETQRKLAYETLMSLKLEETHPEYVGAPRVIR